MSEYCEKQCSICLKNDLNCVNVDGSQYQYIFIKLFDATMAVAESKVLWLCLWCKAIIKKVNDLMDFAKEAKINKQKTETTQPAEYTLTLHHNPHIDIPPKDYNQQKDKDNTGKKDIKLTERINLKKETNIKLSRLKKHKLDEMNFDVLYLNVDEQKKEIEEKKRSEKYKQWCLKCDDCGESFMFRLEYEEHRKRHDLISGQHACKICRLRFKSNDVLSQHTLAHKRRFVCRSCGSKFKRWSHCVVHREKCGSNSTPAVCAVCAKIFGDHHSMTIHMKTVHENTKKYVCEHCVKVFGTKQRLTVHIRSHTGLKPFSCDKCSRSFATHSNLRAHSKVHSNNKDHYCVECNKYYKSEKSLKRHFLEASKHAGDGRYICEDCLKKFITQKLLDKHIMAAHLTEHRCEHCYKLFSNNANLRKHVRSIHTTTEA
ncbi:zinc finger protein 85 [Manduca sexta]|uniref:zinc finger protein 85 n=1 Tax=Manduca sexta TaxID=7130 RepID=UPI0018907ED2|nr:zinc finger protein 85 [Manduca sexta]